MQRCLTLLLQHRLQFVDDHYEHLQGCQRQHDHRFQNLTSGDMTLMVLVTFGWFCSSTPVCLFKISAPVPTFGSDQHHRRYHPADTIQPDLRVSFTPESDLIPQDSFTLTTGSGVGSGNNKLYKLATTGSSLSLVGSVPNGYGDDLTTCTYPMAVLGLPSTVLRLLCVTGPPLSWSASEGGGITGYRVERSPDAASWEAIGYVKAAGAGNGPNDYSFNDPRFSGNKTYYRIVQQSASGQRTYF